MSERPRNIGDMYAQVRRDARVDPSSGRDDRPIRRPGAGSGHVGKEQGKASLEVLAKKHGRHWLVELYGYDPLKPETDDDWEPGD